MAKRHPKAETVAAAIWKTRELHLSLRLAAGRVQHHNRLEAWRAAREEEAKMISRYFPELETGEARGPLGRDMKWWKY